jgi:hypothetical protein
MASLLLMQLLRPTSPQAFAAGTLEGRGWVQSLAHITEWISNDYVGGCVIEEPGSEDGDALALRPLLIQMLPVVCHVATVAHGSSSAAGPSTHQPTRTHSAQASATTPTPAGAAIGGQSASSNSSDCSTPGPTSLASETAPNCALRFPADSTLLLLASAAELVAAGTALAVRSEAACNMLCRGSFDNGTDALETMLCRELGMSSGSAAAAQAASTAGVSDQASSGTLAGASSTGSHRFSTPQAAVHADGASAASKAGGNGRAQGDASPESSQGLQAQQSVPGTSVPGGAGGSNDLATATRAAVALASSLASQGAWWQEAKAKYPLLLIETLYTTYVVSKCHL